MKQFLLGVLVGGTIAGGALWLSAAHKQGPDASTAEPARPAIPSTGTQAPVLVVSSIPQRVASAATNEPLPPGEIVLAVGDGYVFGETRARPNADPETVDIYCQDIRYETSLYCAHGAAPVPAPMTRVGIPKKPLPAARLISDAPEALGDRNLSLNYFVNAGRVGLGFARSASGETYLLALHSTNGHPEVLKRTTRIHYRKVPTREGGGELRLPSVNKQQRLPESDRIAMRRAVELGNSVPGASFVDSRRESRYSSLSDLTQDTGAIKGGYYYLTEVIASDLRIDGASVWANEGVRPTATIRVDGDTFGTPGDLDGKVSNDGYTYFYVGRDLLGTLGIGSYATVVIEGDIQGTLRVRSYTTLYLKGRVHGKLDCKGSCWSTFYLDGHWTQDELEQLGSGFGSVTLHVHTSDLDAGKHKKIGSWREVFVGDPSWAKIKR